MSEGSFSKNKWVLFVFLGFFGVIFCVNGIFIYSAVSSQTGVVTEHPYEKGLDYDTVLNEARTQPDIHEKMIYNHSSLLWILMDKSGNYIHNADVTAHIVRPVQEGYDFDVKLAYTGEGVYEAPVQLPLKGAWVAHLESRWTDNNQEKIYKTTHQFLAN